MFARRILFLLLAAPGALLARSVAASPERPSSSRRDVAQPPRVELVGPSGVIEESSPAFLWKRVEGAEEYLLEVRGRGKAPVFSSWYSAAAVCGDGVLCSVPPTLSLLTLSDGKYTWWVRAKNLAGNGPRSEPFRLTVDTLPPPPAPPVLLAPDRLVSEPSPRFVWEKQESATEYLLEISRRHEILFSEWLKADQTLCPDETCSFIPQNLALDYGRYRTRMRAKNSGGTSRVGRSLWFRVVLGAPTPVAPKGEATPEPEFSWSVVSGATYYIVRVINDAGRVHRARLEAAGGLCGPDACAATFPNLALAPGAYAWFVRGGSETVRGLWSERADFHVGSPPKPPPGPTTLLAPMGTIETPTPSYRWTAVAEATHYALIVSDASQTPRLVQSFSSVEAGCAVECSVQPSTVLEEGVYRFTVTTSNLAGSGPQSAPLDFEIKKKPGTPPAAPTLVSPRGTIGVAAPRFVWNEVTDATLYTLVVEDSAQSVRHQQTYTSAEAACAVECGVTPPLALDNGAYRFRVQSENGAGKGGVGGPLDFTVSRNAPTLVRLLSHNDGDPVSAGGFLVSGTVEPEVQSLAFRMEINGAPMAGPRAIEISLSRQWAVFVLPGELVPGAATLVLEATASGGATEAASLLLDVIPLDFRAGALLSRATFGPTPALLDEIRANGVSAFRDRLLQPTPDPAFESFVASLPTSTAEEVGQYALLHAVFNPNPLQEVMTQFWDNHFSTDMDSHGVPSWELRENVLFRANALGRFRDLLEISAKSPAMLHYLDQTLSGKSEPNENYSREVLELHTLSVDGPYSQRDVEELARILTGWKEQNGQFVFDAADHDDQAKTFLGALFPAGGGLDEGERVLDLLAEHPATARFLCFKLAELFVSEEPPNGLVSSCASVFLDNHLNGNPNQIREVVAHLLDSREFALSANFRAKVKTPLELLTSAVRSLDATVQDANDLERELRSLGMYLFHNRPPDGFAEEADEWVDTGLLLARVDLVNEIAREAPNRETWVDLRQYFRDRGYETAEGIAGYLFGIALQNEFTPLELQIALGILTSGGSSPFDIDAADAEARLRRLVGTVLSFPGFQHQ